MQPNDFIRKWERSELKESSAAQSHFNDLCELLGVQKPTDADTRGDTFCFEKGATKSTGGNGFADVWKKGCFGWEYKGPKADLKAAYNQLQHYAIALENPPLLIVSDTKIIRVHTNWTNTVSEVHEIPVTDLVDAKWRDLLRNCFENPEALKPRRTRDELTANVANEFAELAKRLRAAGHDAHDVAHFVNRLVFCMFAEDVGLLPNKMFERAIDHARREPDKVQDFLKTLFAAMQKGGPVGFESVPWFNGGLFDNDDTLPLDRDDITIVHKAALQNWADIDPSILGTLFERGLDPDKRSQLGAHYTDRDKIMMIIKPVIVEPLRTEWAEILPQIERRLADEAEMRYQASRTQAAAQSGAFTRKANDARKAAEKLHSDFVERLAKFRVLDPACGSGNFLYLALKALKDIEHRANVEAEALGLPRSFTRVGPEAVLGIELNPYAAELARVSVWIGEIQWMRANGLPTADNPILKPLDNIECRDAVLNPDGTRAEWPDADVVVGNPPFLGGKRLRDELGNDYVNTLFSAWRDSVRPEADLVLYWFARSGALVQSGHLQRAGLVSTNSIRGGANRDTLRNALGDGRIFNAWADEPWVVEGAAVRVSLLCFEKRASGDVRLDGYLVDEIFDDLTARPIGGISANLTNSVPLNENVKIAFQGFKFGGPFEIDDATAIAVLNEPINPNGARNSQVIRQWHNGMDITRRPEIRWCLDFGEMSERDAVLFEQPYKILREQWTTENRKRLEKGNRPLRHGEGNTILTWWRHQRPRTELRVALTGLRRFVATPEVSKHRVFVWLDAGSTVSGSVYAIAREDDTTFGILHSKFHEIWALRMGTTLEDRPRYTPSTTFETFPFPEGLTPNIPAADYAEDPRAQSIATAAARLNELRENWLNPPDLVKRVPEVVPGYPDRILPVDERAADLLKRRALTNLYNERPAWLDHAHRDLDRAVAAAYGWQADFDAGALTDEEILKRLFELNQKRAAEQISTKTPL